MIWKPSDNQCSEFNIVSKTANLANSSSKQAWHVSDAVCTVLEVLMMGGEIAQNMQSTDNNKEYCITLHLVGCA
jgi:hypothetical protein